MSTTEIPHVPPVTPPASPAGAPDRVHCDECGTTVDRDQRYCVHCGAHRRTANDPAARYFSQATARRRAAAAARIARPQDARRPSGTVLALALAVIPVAIAVGVLVGRSSNNHDGRLISALNHRQAAQTVTAPTSTPSVTATSTTSAPATSSHTGAHGTKHQAAGGKGKGKAKGKATHKPAAAKAPAGPTAAQKAGYGSTATTPAKVSSSGSAAADKQGAQIVNKLKHTTGTGYLDQLPQQVVVP